MKKFLILLFTFVLSLSLFVAVGCGGNTCKHKFMNGVCTECGYECPHEEYENGVCTECGYECQHDEYINGVCTVCGCVCPHKTYLHGVCSDCGAACTHDESSFYNGVCACGKKICKIHTFDESGFCTTCGDRRLFFTQTPEKLSFDIEDGTQVYKFTKNVDDNCNSADGGYQNGVNYIRNFYEKTFVKFDWYSDDFNYISFMSGDGEGLVPFATCDKMKVMKSDGTIVELDADEGNDGLWTGYTLPKGEWLTMVVDVRGIYDLGFVYWMEHAGTVKIKNIEFFDICKSNEDYMSFDLVDGEIIFNLLKVDGVESDNYGINSIYFEIPSNRYFISFDIMSPDFDYFKLSYGDGDFCTDVDFSKKVVITEKATGNKITTTEANSTGHVLELDKWYSVKVDVSDVRDLLIVYDYEAFGFAYVKNIQLNPALELCETHSYGTNHVCTVCGYVCPHDEYENGVCKECGYVCPHDEYENGVCKECGEIACKIHNFVEQDGVYVCETCGIKQSYLVKTAAYLSIDAVNEEQIYTYTKVAGKACNSADHVYHDGANYIRNYDEKQFVKFEWYSDDFNYIQFISGTGVDFYNCDNYAKVTVTKSADGTVVELDESGPTWTGETLPKGEWLTFVVDVDGIYDLGFVYWSGEAGTTQIKNIEFFDAV